MTRSMVLAFVVSSVGCAAKQTALAPLSATPPSRVQEEAAPLVVHPDERLTEVRLGTPSGLGVSTRRVDAARADDVSENRDQKVALRAR